MKQKSPQLKYLKPSKRAKVIQIANILTDQILEWYEIKDYLEQTNYPQAQKETKQWIIELLMELANE